mgnify:CR=1 FL=1
MDGMSRFKSNVIKGLILDERGNWIDLKEKVRKEREFIKHVAAGEVLFDNQWVSIAEAKKLLKKTAKTVSSITDTVSIQVLSQAQNKKLNRQNDLQYPPETSLLTNAEPSPSGFYNDIINDEELLEPPTSDEPSFFIPPASNSDYIIPSDETIQESPQTFFTQQQAFQNIIPPGTSRNDTPANPAKDLLSADTGNIDNSNKSSVYEVSQLALKKTSPRDTHYIVINEEPEKPDVKNESIHQFSRKLDGDDEIACQETIAIRVDQIPYPKETDPAIAQKPVVSVTPLYKEETVFTSPINKSSDKTGIYTIEEINLMKSQDISDQTDGIYSTWEQDRKRRKKLITVIVAISIASSGIGAVLAWLFL